MEIKRLTMEYVRGFEHVTIAFEPGMNLLVGENGAGKSTVLDVLRKLLTEVLPTFTAYRGDVEHFHTDDMMVGMNWLSAELEFNIDDLPLVYEIREWSRNERLDRGELRCIGSSETSVKDELRALWERKEIETYLIERIERKNDTNFNTYTYIGTQANRSSKPKNNHTIRCTPCTP